MAVRQRFILAALRIGSCQVQSIDPGLVASDSARTKKNDAADLFRSTFCAVARELWASQADLEALTGDGRTPLHVAAFYDQEDVVSFLCQQRVDVNSSSCGFTPLHFASWRNNPDVVQVLCSFNADLQKRDVFGATPVSMAAYYGRHAIVQCMLEAEAAAGI
eukprot:symbB.v1.2.018419.t1/scaffold1470.1/size116919/2